MPEEQSRHRKRFEKNFIPWLLARTPFVNSSYRSVCLAHFCIGSNPMAKLQLSSSKEASRLTSHIVKHTSVVQHEMLAIDYSNFVGA
ncbi:MAG: hypothetical protein C4326_02850 [Ignavibacteria bacterium]